MILEEIRQKVEELGEWHYNFVLDGVTTGESLIEFPHPKLVELLRAGAFSRKIYPRVLDLGSNSGLISQWFVQNKNSQVDAVEFHPKYFAQLELVIKVKALNIKAIYKDIHEGDFGKNEYDLVLLLGVMHHLQDDLEIRMKVLKDCVTSLLPGGELVIQTESSLPIAEMMRDVGLFGVEKFNTNWSDRSAWFGFKDPMKLF